MDQNKLKKLWLEIKTNDEKAFGKLYDLLVNQIYRFVFLKVSSKEAAEEIVQDVFLKLWAIRLKEMEINNVLGLCYQIARFRVIDYYRSQEKEIKAVSIEEYGDEVDMLQNEQDPELLDKQFDFLEVKNSLLNLPEVYKDVIIMKYLDDLTNEEIALAMEKEVGNVRVILHRAMKELRKRIKETRE